MDEMLFENKAIKPGYQVVRKNDIRTLETKLGTLTYQRRYYRSEEKGYHYLVDDILSINPRSRVVKEEPVKIRNQRLEVKVKDMLEIFTNSDICTKDDADSFYSYYSNNYNGIKIWQKYGKIKGKKAKKSLSFLLLLLLFFKGVSGIRCIDSSIYNRRWLQVLTLYRFLGSQNLQ